MSFFPVLLAINMPATSIIILPITLIHRATNQYIPRVIKKKRQYFYVKFALQFSKNTNCRMQMLLLQKVNELSVQYWQSTHCHSPNIFWDSASSMYKMHCWHCWHMHAVIHVLIKLHVGGTVENYFYNSIWVHIWVLMKQLCINP